MNQTAVLVISDSQASLKTVSQNLEQRNISYQTAGSADEAVAQMRELFCRIVIADISFNCQDDVELISRLRRINPLSQIFVFTEDPSVELLIDLADRGVVDFFSRTKDVSKLLDRIVCSIHTATRWLNRLKFSGSQRLPQSVETNTDLVQSERSDCSPELVCESCSLVTIAPEGCHSVTENTAE